MAQSAFQALQKESDAPMYQANTSDEDDGSNGEPDQELATPLRTQTSTPMQLNESAFSTFQPQQDSKYVCSKFTPNDDNIVYNDKYVIFGLRNNQSLLIRGQFTLEVQKGAVDINGVVYHSSCSPLKFLNPVSNAIPLIQATQVTDSSRLSNNETAENKHLFTPDYKTVIKATNLHTGLETIGRLCPQFKNLFWNAINLSPEDIRSISEYEEALTGYTFFPILKPSETVSVMKPQSWTPVIKRLASLHKDNNLLKVVVIGGKNSGKSTLIRLLLQHLFATVEDIPIHVLDLDPGQPEYSKPDCISLSKIKDFQFGNHLSLTSPDSQTNHYIGFSSPKDQPKRYDNFVNDLISRYQSDGAHKHESLLVNTPGWIKGYGLSLTKKLIERLKPTHVIYLNSGDPDLEDMQFPPETEIIPMLGTFSNGAAKFSSAQLRVLKLLAYLHKKDNYRFDFDPLVFSPPLQVSYGTKGIRALTVISESGIFPESGIKAIEAAVVAICTVKQTTLLKLPIKESPLPFVEGSKFDVAPRDITFKGLGLVHSVDTKNKVMNIYIPDTEDFAKQDVEEFIMIRARTETPIWELASHEVSKNFGRTNLPYVTYEKLSDYDKSWKVRKNVQRRGQQ